jgi:hypothetical protein
MGVRTSNLTGGGAVRTITQDGSGSSMMMLLSPAIGSTTM